MRLLALARRLRGAVGAPATFIGLGGGLEVPGLRPVHHLRRGGPALRHFLRPATVGEFTAGYMLAIGIAWGLAHTLVTRAHIRVDVLVNRLPLGLRAWLHLAWRCCCSAVFGELLPVVRLGSGGMRACCSTRTTIPRCAFRWCCRRASAGQGIGAFCLMVAVLALEALLALLAGRAEELDRMLGGRTFEDEEPPRRWKRWRWPGNDSRSFSCSACSAPRCSPRPAAARRCR
jgi:hypothetical protein